MLGALPSSADGETEAQTRKRSKRSDRTKEKSWARDGQNSMQNPVLPLNCGDTMQAALSLTRRVERL